MTASAHGLSGDPDGISRDGNRIYDEDAYRTDEIMNDDTDVPGSSGTRLPWSRR